jgi:hypothetical protein
MDELLADQSALFLPRQRQDLWDLLEHDRDFAMDYSFRYCRSEKRQPQSLANDLWIIFRGSGQLLDGLMAAVG